MKKDLEKRLEELETELEKGQQQLHELDTRRMDMEKMLLRISGAIQVIKELLGRTENSPGEPQKESTTDT